MKFLLQLRLSPILAAALLAGCAQNTVLGLSGTGHLNASRRAASNAYVFVTNDTQGGAAEVDYWPVGSTGNIAPTGVIAGTNTGLSYGLEGIAVNSAGEIYVVNGSTSTILGFAPNSNGNVTPNVSIRGASTGLVFPIGLALDSGGNLYVANANPHGPPSIEEFVAGSNGNIRPIKTISGSRVQFTNPSGIAVDSSGKIFLADDALGAVFIFDNRANGNVAPIRKILGQNTHLAGAYGLSVGALGIYACTYSNPAYLERFSLTARGDALPRASISRSNTQLNPWFDGMIVAPDGTIYVVDRGTGGGGNPPPSIVQFAGDANGDATPMTDITGPSTRLDIPLYVYVGTSTVN